MDYLFEIFGIFGWENDEECWEVLCWMIFDNQKVLGLIGILWFMCQFVKIGEMDIVKFFDVCVCSVLKILEKYFVVNDFVIGDKLIFVDFLLCSYMYYDGEYGIDFGEYLNVLVWFVCLKVLFGWKYFYDFMFGYLLLDVV